MRGESRRSTKDLFRTTAAKTGLVTVSMASSDGDVDGRG